MARAKAKERERRCIAPKCTGNCSWKPGSLAFLRLVISPHDADDPAQNGEVGHRIIHDDGPERLIGRFQPYSARLRKIIFYGRFLADQGHYDLAALRAVLLAVVYQITVTSFRPLHGVTTAA